MAGRFASRHRCSPLAVTNRSGADQRTCGLSEGAVEAALAVLGARGLAGYDTTSGRYFHRVLPFDLERVEQHQPRLKNARELIDHVEIVCPSRGRRGRQSARGATSIILCGCDSRGTNAPADGIAATRGSGPVQAYSCRADESRGGGQREAERGGNGARRGNFPRSDRTRLLGPVAAGSPRHDSVRASFPVPLDYDSAEFAAAFDGLSEADRKQLSKTAQEIFAEARANERERFGLPTYAGGLARLALLACCGGSQAKRVKSDGFHGMILDRSGAILARKLGDLGRRLEKYQRRSGIKFSSCGARPGPTTGSPSNCRSREAAGVSLPGYVDPRAASDARRRYSTAGRRWLHATHGLGGANDFDPVSDADLLETEIWQLFAAQNTGFSWVPEKKATPGPQDRPFHGWPRGASRFGQQGTDRPRPPDR